MTTTDLSTATDDPTARGLDSAPTTHARLIAWVREVAELTRPDAVRWVDGSQAEYEQLTGELVASGTFVRLEKKPDSFWCASDPSDVARVEDRTFICSRDEADAGPTNNWMDPGEMRRMMTDLYRGSMRGRTMYVIPFVWVGWTPTARCSASRSPTRRTSSPACGSWRRIGAAVLERMGQDAAVRQVPALGGCPAGARAGRCRLAVQPDEVHHPLPRDPGDLVLRVRATAATPCSARSATRCGSPAPSPATRAGWPSTCSSSSSPAPQQQVHYVAAAFPSACGKTNLAMIEPTLPGWTAEMIGDDIAWMRFGADGRLYAVNPEAGLFGVAPGTGWHTNPNAMRAVEKGGTIFTNVALTDDGDVWWEGMTKAASGPPHRAGTADDWTPGRDEPLQPPEQPVLHPDRELRILAPEYHDPQGVPI